jgi:hypothetical protein
MGNKARKSVPRASVPQLNVRPFPEELLRRISAVAGAKGQTQKEFVIEALDERTSEYKSLVEEIYKREMARKTQRRNDPSMGAR